MIKFLCVGWQAQLWLLKAGIRGGCSLDFIKKAVPIGDGENLKPDKLDTAIVQDSADNVLEQLWFSCPMKCLKLWKNYRGSKSLDVNGKTEHLSFHFNLFYKKDTLRLIHLFLSFLANKLEEH